MLQAIRDRATGWFAWVIVSLIIVPFALWGVHHYVEKDHNPTVLKVGNSQVTLREFQRIEYEQRGRLVSSFGEAVLKDESLLKNIVLSNLIESELYFQSALRKDLAVSDIQVATLIQGIPALQEEGHFDHERYQRLLRQQGMNEVRFESEIRRDQLINQWISGVTQTSFIVSPVLNQWQRLRYQQREIAYALLSPQTFAKEVSLKEEEIRQYYDKNLKTEFMSPEQVQVSYLEFRADGMIPSLESISDENIRAYYEEHKADYSIAEKRQARHILLSVPTNATQQEDQAVHAKMTELLASLKKGEKEFAELAKTYSQDKGSASAGGSLGWVSSGQMVEAFDKTLFALKQGELSEPVKTQFGWHIILLEQIDPARTKSLEEAKQDIAKKLAQREAETLFQKKIDQITNLAYDHPDSLEEVAKSSGLTVHVSPWVSQTGASDKTGQGSKKEESFQNSKFLQVAFSENVRAGENSEPILLNTGHAVVLRANGYQPPAPKPFDSVRQIITEKLVNQQAGALCQKRGESLFTQLQQGTLSPEEAGALAWKDPTMIQRDTTAVPREIVQAAYQLPKPKEGQSYYGGTLLADGSYALIRLQSVRDGETEKSQGDDRSSAMLKNVIAESELDRMKDAMRKDIPIEIYNAPQ